MCQGADEADDEAWEDSGLYALPAMLRLLAIRATAAPLLVSHPKNSERVHQISRSGVWTQRNPTATVHPKLTKIGFPIFIIATCGRTGQQLCLKSRGKRCQSLPLASRKRMWRLE